MFELFAEQHHQGECGTLLPLTADPGAPLPKQGSRGKCLLQVYFKGKRLKL